MTIYKYDYGRKNVSNQKKRFSLYYFKYLQHKKNGKLEHLDKPYVWHIHEDQSKYKNIMLDFYLYGTNVSVLQSYGEIFIKKCMACKKKEINNTSGETIRFQLESWLDYFLLGNIYIVGLDVNKFELRWQFTYRRCIRNIKRERLDRLKSLKEKPIFGNIYFMDTYPTNTNKTYEQNVLEAKKRQLEFDILGCKKRTFVKI